MLTLLTPTLPFMFKRHHGAVESLFTYKQKKKTTDINLGSINVTYDECLSIHSMYF